MDSMNAPEEDLEETTNPLILGLAWMAAAKVIREAKQRAAYFPLAAGGGALGGSSL